MFVRPAKTGIVLKVQVTPSGDVAIDVVLDVPLAPLLAIATNNPFPYAIPLQGPLGRLLPGIAFHYVPTLYLLPEMVNPLLTSSQDSALLPATLVAPFQKAN